jgi:flagellar FliL protein
MAETEEKPNDNTAAETTGGGKKKIIMAAVALILVLGGAAGAYFTGALDSLLGKEPDCTNVAEGDEHFAACQDTLAKAEAEKPAAVFMEVPDLIVNLSTGGKQTRFLKIGIKLELKDDAELKKLEPLMPRVIDHFQTYLRELRPEDLGGSAGIYRLRIELLSRVKAAAPNVTVNDILFQEILMQ